MSEGIIIPPATQTENRAAALELARAGFKVFPVGPDKRPLVKDWGECATDDARQIKRWWRQFPDAAPALPTGERNGVSVIDLDLHGEADGLVSFEALGFDPETAADLIVSTPSGGRHLYFDHRPGVRNSASKIAPGVDVRGDGGYVVAPGAITKAGRYEMSTGDLDILRMFGTGFPADLIPAEHEADAEDQPEPGGHDLGQLWDALSFIPSDGGREPWVETLKALHHGSGGSAAGLALANAWSARDYAAYSRKEVDTIWRSFGRKGGAQITADTLLARARENGWQAISDDLLDDLDEPGSEESVLDAESRALLGELPEPQPDADGVTAWSLDDCAAAAARPYVIKGLIGERDVACLVGAPGAGKSVLAPALAHAVAQGREIYGRRVKQGKVFYVAAEDQHGMMGRLSALRDAYGLTRNLVLLGGISDLLNPEAGKKWSRHARNLAQRVKDERPKLVVIDTLAMSFPGLEENSAEGMGRVMAVARALTKWGAAVLLIHHDTKMGDGLPRGHSLLNGALDVSIHVRKKNNGVVVGTLTKNRNGPCDVNLAYRIDAAEMGVDEDGDPVTAPIWRECPPVEDEDDRPKLPPSAKAALSLIVDMWGDGDEASEAEFRKQAADGLTISGSDNRDNRRKAVDRALNRLVTDRQIQVRGGVIRRPDDGFSDLLTELDDLEGGQ